MKKLLLLVLSITVVLGMPNFQSKVGENPEENQHPVVGDVIPAHGHVVVEHPAPQVLLSPKKQQENPDPEEQKEKEAEAEPKEKPGLTEVQGLKTDMKSEEKEELKPDPKPAAEAPVEEEAKPEAESELIEEPDLKVESEVKVEVKGQPQYELEEEEEDKEETDFRVQSEVRVETEVKMELEPEEVHVLNAAPEQFLEVEERHIDMEKKPMPIMELEPLDDGDVHGDEVSKPVLSEEEMAFREAFEEEETPAEHLTEEEEEEEEEEDKVDGEENLQEENEDQVSDEEVEPELAGEQSPDGIPETAALDEEPIDPEMQQAVPLPQNSFPAEEAEMGMYVRDGAAPEQFLEEPAMEEEGFPKMMGDDKYRQGARYCPGIVTDGKCHQFFRERKTFEDAEFFCQEQFSGGHLASITSQHLHQQLMSLVQQNSGYTRTWVGGLRIEKRFVWLDGSRWSYEDWLSGEPNHTSNVEYCVEILGDGKFNDFPCWNLQAFICSYPTQ
ncbi:PREDICTED: ABC transporter F family member 4-like [Cyprinodon variegatus]|nr:PREDICTED: ABC transporter F family member 4-like [Cyprinodon variegatus]XP_015254631.1 PREDICTED: ABC transporter F family member 4-like [Cyprinodon variegatus]